MLDEEVVLIRAAYDALNARDLPGMFRVLDPEIEWQPSRQFPDARVYHGFEGVECHFSGLWEDFEHLRYELEEFIAGDGACVVIGRLHCRGRASGAQADYRFGHVWRTRAGKITRVEIYLHPDEALQAAGMAPEASRLSAR